MSKKTLLILVIVLAVLMVGGTLLYKQLAGDAEPGTTVNNEQGEAEAEEKHRMPDFTVYDADGNAVHLTDFRGKPVVLNFWASWCGPCKSEMPAFNDTAEDLNGEVVFLDEPTGGVDPVTRRQFWELIYEAADKGTTIFVTTHYMDEAEYCTRVSIMVDGEVCALGTPAQLKQQYSTESMDEVFRILARGAKRGE